MCVCMCVCNRAPPGLVSKVHRTFVAYRASLQLSRKCLPRRRSARKCPALSTSARRVQLTRRPTEPSWNTSREGVFTSTLFSSYPSHNSRALVLLREQPACALLESAHSEYMKLRSGSSKSSQTCPCPNADHISFLTTLFTRRPLHWRIRSGIWPPPRHCSHVRN